MIQARAPAMNPAPSTPGPRPPYPDNRIRDLPAGERPQERLERLGAAALSDTELLAMLLRSGTRGQDVLTLSSRLVAEAGSLAGLLAWHDADFRSLRGIGRVKALQLVAAMEVAVDRLVRRAQRAGALRRDVTSRDVLELIPAANRHPDVILDGLRAVPAQA